MLLITDLPSLSEAHAPSAWLSWGLICVRWLVLGFVLTKYLYILVVSLSKVLHHWTGIVAHTFKASTPEAGSGSFLKIKVNMVYIRSSGPARTTR